MALVGSVNVGTAVDVPWGKLGRTGIDKRPVDGPVRVHVLGVGTDEVADQVNHGGAVQAVYAYSREDLDTWGSELGRTLVAGQFGENLTTAGIDMAEVRAGDRWRVGSVLLEVSGVRIPCSVFQGFMSEQRWVRRFVQAARPGAYFRVVEEGELRAGDTIEVVERRDHDLTLPLVFRALTTERGLTPRLAVEPRLDEFVRRRTAQRRDGAAR